MSCVRVLDGLEMPVEWVLSGVVLIFQGNGMIMNCCCYRGVRLIEHDVKMGVKVLGKET